MKCNNCGHMISDKAEKCPKCGIKKGEKVPADEYAKEEVVAPVCDENSKKVAKRISKKYSSLIVLIVLAFISIGGIVYYFSRNKEELVELYPDFYKKIRIYEEIYGFSDGMAAVKRDGKWGYINTEGEEVIQCQYNGSLPHDRAFSFHDGLAVVIAENDKYGYIDKKGNFVVKPIYAEASSFSCGVACVCKEDRGNIDFIDKNGNLIESLSGKYSGDIVGDLPSFYNDTCQVLIAKPKEKQREGDWYDCIWIDIHGNRVKSPYRTKFDYYDEPVSDEKGWIPYESNGNYGYKDKDGNIVIQAKYKSIGSFSNGVALVTIGYGSSILDSDYFRIDGFVDRNGKDTFTPADYKKIEAAEWNNK